MNCSKVFENRLLDSAKPFRPVEDEKITCLQLCPQSGHFPLVPVELRVFSGDAVHGGVSFLLWGEVGKSFVLRSWVRVGTMGSHVWLPQISSGPMVNWVPKPSQRPSDLSLSPPVPPVHLRMLWTGLSFGSLSRGPRLPFRSAASRLTAEGSLSLVSPPGRVRGGLGCCTSGMDFFFLSRNTPMYGLMVSIFLL